MLTKIEKNERFDRLTNLDISTYYRDRDYYFVRGDFLGAFAFWLVKQSPYDTPDITAALNAFGEFVGEYIPTGECRKFTYDTLKKMINADIFESIPEIEKLNHRANGRECDFGFQSRYDKPHPDDDFIDLWALAHNIFYMMLREDITQRGVGGKHKKEESEMESNE